MHHLAEMVADLLSNLPLVGGRKKDKKAVSSRITGLEYRPVCRISEPKNHAESPVQQQQLPDAE